MDKKVKERWITALRSGDYVQGQHSLECNGKNCCLGVIARVEKMTVEEVRLGTTYFLGEDGSLNAGFLPDDAFGLSMEVQLKLSRMNDEGASFAEIADYIEVAL